MAVLESPLHGLLIVDKPGWSDPHGGPPGSCAPAADVHPERTPLLTSHDVVNRVRRWSGQRRIGHTGTLDPLASGLLLLCLGKATRLAEYYQGERKTYVAEILLGQATDTYDVLGATVATARVPELSLEHIERVLAHFRGAVLQQPPAFSAIKQGGEALYRKARRGETVVVDARPVTFYALDVLAFTPPDRLQLHVECSAGAYVRSLAYDLGLALDTFGCLATLRRTKIGAMTLAEAKTLSTIETAAHEGRLDQLLKPIGWGLPLPTLRLELDLMQRLGFGQTVVLPESSADPEWELAQGIDAQGACVGILRRLGSAPGELQGWVWKAEKWLL